MATNVVDPGRPGGRQRLGRVDPQLAGHVGRPPDGRISGYQFAAHVLGVATGSLLPGTPGAQAGSGQQLWVFGLRWSADQTDDSGDPAAVTAILIVEGNRIQVPLTQPQPAATGTTGPVDSGPEYFLASVPSQAPDVELELAASGFAQDFSLSRMSREGAQPAALYRDPTSWRVTQPTTLSKDLVTPYQDSLVDLPDAKLTIEIDSLTLSYFGPDGTSDPAPSTSQAWPSPTSKTPTRTPTATSAKASSTGPLSPPLR